MPSTWATVLRAAAPCPVVESRACASARVEQNPAASMATTGPPATPAPPASTNAATTSARSAGVAAAVPSSQCSTGSTGAGGANPAKSGSTGRSAAAASARWTSAASPSSSVRVVPARATRPSTATVSRTPRLSSLVFWWMCPLAKRVSALVPASALATPSPRPPSRDSTRSHSSTAVPAAPVRSGAAAGIGPGR